MFKRLKCRIRGHRFVCDQIINLNPDGTGNIDHTHQCMACGKVKQFPSEPLEDEFLLMLHDLMGPSKVGRGMDYTPVEAPKKQYLN